MAESKIKSEIKERAGKPRRQKKSVTIEEADNGYLVRMYEPSTKPSSMGAERRMICKDFEEVRMAV